jgi:hypothetical protein
MEVVREHLGGSQKCRTMRIALLNLINYGSIWTQAVEWRSSPHKCSAPDRLDSRGSWCVVEEEHSLEEGIG